MITCANCHKHLPAGDHFCAYCGTRQPWRLPWFAGRGLPVGQRPAFAAGWRTPPRQWVTAALGGALGATAGAAVGALLGELWLGLTMGALGVGAAAAVADLTAGAIPDQAAAQRFGLVMGATAGLLALPLGLLVLALVLGVNQGWEGLVFLRGLMQVKFSYGVLGTLIGTVVATIGGGGLGYYLGRAGYDLGRGGALLGAALAWTVAAGAAGLIAGDYAGQIIGVERLGAARLGVMVQIGVGALLLAALRPALGRLRWWWGRRP